MLFRTCKNPSKRNIQKSYNYIDANTLFIYNRPCTEVNQSSYAFEETFLR